MKIPPEPALADIAPAAVLIALVPVPVPTPEDAPPAVSVTVPALVSNELPAASLTMLPPCVTTLMPPLPVTARSLAWPVPPLVPTLIFTVPAFALIAPAVC